LQSVRHLSLVGILACLGCGPGSTVPDAGKAQSPADYKAEMEKQQSALMGDAKPAPPKQQPAPSAEQPAAEGAAPAEQPAEKAEK
jgi:hypothetical protein